MMIYKQCNIKNENQMHHETLLDKYAMMNNEMIKISGQPETYLHRHHHYEAIFLNYERLYEVVPNLVALLMVELLLLLVVACVVVCRF